MTNPPYDPVILSHFNEQAGSFTSYWAKPLTGYNPKDREANVAFCVIPRSYLRSAPVSDYAIIGCYDYKFDCKKNTDNKWEVLLSHLKGCDTHQMITEFLQEIKRTQVYELGRLAYDITQWNDDESEYYAPTDEREGELPYIVRTEQIFVPSDYKPHKIDAYHRYEGRTFDYLRYPVAKLASYPVLGEITTAEELNRKFGEHIYPTQAFLLADDNIGVHYETGRAYSVPQKEKAYTPTCRGYHFIIGQAHKMIKVASFIHLSEGVEVLKYFRDNVIEPKLLKDPLLRDIPKELYANHVDNFPPSLAKRLDAHARFKLG